MTISANVSLTESDHPFDYLLDAHNNGGVVLGNRCQVVSVTQNTIEPGFNARLSEVRKPDISIEATEVLGADDLIYNAKIV